MTPPPTHLNGDTTAPPSLTSTPTISSSATTPTIPSYGPPPPPPQPPPAPNILPSFRVSGTDFASRIALQPKGRGGSFKSGLNFAVAGAGAEMNETRKDIFTQITQSPPPPPAPNILENAALFLFPFFYSQVAEVSIAHKPAHRRQAPEGNCHKQAFAIETPLRDGQVKHYFVKSEQIGLSIVMFPKL